MVDKLHVPIFNSKLKGRLHLPETKFLLKAATGRFFISYNRIYLNRTTYHLVFSQNFLAPGVLCYFLRDMLLHILKFKPFLKVYLCGLVCLFCFGGFFGGFLLGF